MDSKMKIIITGSEGLLGKEISKFLEKDNNIIKLDLLLFTIPECNLKLNLLKDLKT